MAGFAEKKGCAISRRLRRPLGLASTMMLIGGVAPGGVLAQTLEEVLVTAERRESRLLDAPVAISAYGEGFLSSQGIGSLQDLTHYSPSLRFESGALSARNSFLDVRGIGSSGLNAGIDPTVGVYIDSVYQPRQAMALTRLADTEVVELLKGPQGTLFGANTPGGVISVRTKQPTQDFQAKLKAGIGDNALRETSMWVTGGLTDNLAASASFWTYEQEGWFDLLSTTRVRDASNSHEEWGGRFKALWTPNERLEVTATASWSETTTTCCDFEYSDISTATTARWQRIATGLNLNFDDVFPRPSGDGYEGLGEKLDHSGFSRGVTGDEFVAKSASLKVNYDIAGGILANHSLQVVASYSDWKSVAFVSSEDHGVAMSQNGPSRQDHETATIEILLNSPAGQTFEYQLGAFALVDDALFTQVSNFELPGCMFNNFTDAFVARGVIPDTVEGRSRCAGAGRSDEWTQTWNSQALFARMTFNPTEQLALSIGGRVSRDEKEAEKLVYRFDAESEQIVQNFGLNCPECTFGGSDIRINSLGILFGTNGFETDVSDTEMVWSATANYLVDGNLIKSADDLSLYARVATGYKSPGINARPIRGDNIPLTFGPEQSINYELGLKSVWLDSKVSLNLTLFRNDFKDLQATVANPVADAAGIFGTAVQNAGELRQQGVEFELQAVPTEWLTLISAITYLDSEFLEFGGSPCPQLREESGVPIDPNFGAPFCDVTGFPNIRSPKWRSTQTLRVSFPVANTNFDVFAQGSWIFNDGMYLFTDYDIRSFQEAYSLFDFRAGLESRDRRWKMEVWGKNLTDKHYFTGMATQFGAFPGRVGRNASGPVGLPRWLGASVEYSFE